MTYAVDKVFIDAILIRLLRELGLPETIPHDKLRNKEHEPRPNHRDCRLDAPIEQREDSAVRARRGAGPQRS